MENIKERCMRWVFLIAACASILSALLIYVFLFANGLPAIFKIGPLKFLFGSQWKPGNDLYGIAPMIVGSLYVTAAAVGLGVPLGILTAVYMARFCGSKAHKILSPAVSLMAGIPSIIYGFFGMVVIVPVLRSLGLGGKSVLSAGLVLGIMILPTVISVSESAIRSVPDAYYEGALALGASHERSVFFVQLPAAKSGLFAAIVLGIGRAIGETMAVIMVAGNQPVFPKHITAGVRTLTANIVLELGYATDLHRNALIATAVVLAIFILLINLLLFAIKRRQDT